jgi:hypothetical protein
MRRVIAIIFMGCSSLGTDSGERGGAAVRRRAGRGLRRARSRPGWLSRWQSDRLRGRSPHLPRSGVCTDTIVTPIIVATKDRPPDSPAALVGQNRIGSWSTLARIKGMNTKRLAPATSLMIRGLPG